MKQVKLGPEQMPVPAVVIGCMRLNELEPDQLPDFLSFCVDNGLNYFDHADIYNDGKSEEMFAEAFRKTGLKREDIVLQSKCGIVPGKMYSSDKDYILDSVDGILKRLDTDYLDVLLLHRPDALMEPEQVAEAFDELERSGKVRAFGVSNFRPGQIELLKKYVKQPLIINQLQFSIPNSNMIAQGMEANMATPGSVDHDGGVLDYSRLHDMTIQTWSPFQYGNWEGVFVGNYDKWPELNKALDELAEKYGVTPTGIAAAWILRHPAGMQLISGSTKKSRVQEILDATAIDLSREDWYRLYLAAGHILP